MRERWREGERDPPKKLSPFYLPLQDCLPFCLQLIISSRTPPSQPPFDWKRNQREAIEGLAGQLLPLAMSDVLNICGLPKKSEAKWKRRRELPACCHSSLSFSRPVSSKWCITNPGHYRKRDIGHTDHLCERYEDVFDKICDFSLSLLAFLLREDIRLCRHVAAFCTAGCQNCPDIILFLVICFWCRESDLSTRYRNMWWTEIIIIIIIILLLFALPSFRRKKGEADKAFSQGIIFPGLSWSVSGYRTRHYSSGQDQCSSSRVPLVSLRIRWLGWVFTTF